MRRFFTALGVLFISTTAVNAETCFVQVSGVIHLEGECRFEQWTGGDFRIISPDGTVYVDFTLDTPTRGFANWNDYQLSADTPLGHLSRTGGCWSNPTATICAWK